MEDDKRGRPTKFKPEYVNIIKKMCELGATVADVAKGIGVAESTIYLWAIKHKELQEAMRVGKEPADDKAEMSLYTLACGYEREEVDIRVCDGKVVETPIKKWYPPNATALIYWTSNRRPDRWSRNKDNGESTEDMSAILSKLIDKLPS